MQQSGRLVVREDLADLSNEYRPGDTTQVTHDIRADSSILCPDLNHPQSLLEVLRLLASQLQYHQIVLPSEERGPALIILDSIEQIHGYNLFNIPRNGLSLQLTETDIDLYLLIGESDDGYLGIGSGG